MNIKVFTGENSNVKKYVFTKEDAVYEAVVYKYGSYEERTVICCSVQSGCPVGCVFCGTGKRFVRNLTHEEIVAQINDVIIREDLIDKTDEIQKFQIMFMSMGEPMLNWEAVEEAISDLAELYPNAQLLLSTVGIKNHTTLGKLLDLSVKNKNVGLQFSIHQPDDTLRDKLIPFKNKLTLAEISAYGKYWSEVTGKQVYLNYCVNNDKEDEFYNERIRDLCYLTQLFDSRHFAFTFSVICNPNKNSTSKDDEEYLKSIRAVESYFLNYGYNTRIFDPAGKDDIGGGCGQLWFVQDWLASHVQ